MVQIGEIVRGPVILVIPVKFFDFSSLWLALLCLALSSLGGQNPCPAIPKKLVWGIHSSFFKMTRVKGQGQMVRPGSARSNSTGGTEHTTRELEGSAPFLLEYWAPIVRPLSFDTTTGQAIVEIEKFD